MSGAGAVVQCGPGGPIYVADTFNFRIRQMTPSPTTTVIGSGVQGYKGDAGPATSAEIGEVYGMACGNGGHEVLFFADGSSGTIRLFDNDGNVSTLWYGFSFPTAVLASYTGEELWVADAGAGVIWYLNNSRGSACVLAGIGPRGYNCNNGAAARTALHVPWGLSSGGGGLLISEAGANRIR